jgi:hypothetical protein
MGSAETVADDSPSTDEPPSEPQARRWRSASSYSLAAISVALVFAFGAVRLVRPLGRPFTTFGDIAYIELGVRQALHHGNALGVYSRFGWHHPGPALFYLMVPLYWVSGDSSRSLFLTAWLINGASALTAVWIVRARAGEWAARLMTIVLFASMLVFGFRHFIDPWNPKVLAFPMLLLMVSAAATYSGSAWACVVALITASYLVQTHLGTFPVSVALLLLAAIGFARRWTRTADGAGTRAPRRSLRAPLMVAIGLLTLMWIAPVVQEVTNHNGNLTQIVSFYAHPPADAPTSHSLSSSFAAVSNPSTTVPLGIPKDTHGHRSRLLTAGAFAALGLAAAAVARHRAPFIAALGLTTTIGLAVAVLAASRVVGPQDAYLFYWTETLPFPAIVAGGWLVLDWTRSAADRRSDPDTAAARRSYGLVISVVSAIAVVVLLGCLLRIVAHAAPTSIGDGPNARIITARIELELGDKRRPFTLHDEVPKLSEPGALSVQLDKDGYHFHVDPTVNLYRGNITAPVAGPTFVIRAADATAVTEPGERLVAIVGKIEVVERT